jgi:hypothetical protein
MRFAWVSWKPPDLAPESELQLSQAISTFGKAPFIKRFWGFSARELPPSESSFFETHAAGLIYIGLIIAGFLFLDGNAPPPQKGSGGGALVLFVAVGWLGAIIFYGSMIVAAGRYAAWLTSIERKYRLPTATPPRGNTAPDDNVFYEVVAGELDQKRIDKALWTRAEANSAGDDKLAKSLYIRYRAQALQDGQAQKARAEHEAQVLERERQKAQERQIKEAADRKAAEERSKGCGIAFLVCIGIFILFAVIASIGGGQSQPTAPTYSPPPPRPPPTPSLAERQAAINRTFADLDTEYRALAARRASLAPNDSAQLAAFNRDAADYTRRVQQARAEKARLEQ